MIKIDATTRRIYLSLKAANYGEAEFLREAEAFVPTSDPDAIERIFAVSVREKRTKRSAQSIRREQCEQ